jgi:hypothetical protein
MALTAMTFSKSPMVFLSVQEIVGGLTRVYRDWRQDLRIFANVACDPKRLIMQVSPSSEVYMLAYQTVAQSSSLDLAIRFHQRRQRHGH